MDSDLFQKLKLELRRGSLVLAVLAQCQQEQYGYSLRVALKKQGLDIEEGTLYPLIRRLETQGLLESEWREVDKRNKRFYLISQHGQTMLTELALEWRKLNSAIERIL